MLFFYRNRSPVGTVLGKAIVPPTNYTYGSATAASVLWECDASDLPNIYFLVATNGDDRVGGYWDLGAQDGMPNVGCMSTDTISFNPCINYCCFNFIFDAEIMKNTFLAR